MKSADFYLMTHDGSLEWIGSSIIEVDLNDIPKDLFINYNALDFEDKAINIIEENKGNVKTNGDAWPWLWNDSQGTDYTFIYHECSGKVLLCLNGGRPVDSIKVLQGMDLIGADFGIGKLYFPNMLRNKKE